MVLEFRCLVIWLMIEDVFAIRDGFGHLIPHNTIKVDEALDDAAFRWCFSGGVFERVLHVACHKLDHEDVVYGSVV